MIDFSHIRFAGIEIARPALPSERARRAASGSAVVRTEVPRRGFADDPDVSLDPFLHWLLEQAAVDPAKYRASAVNRRLLACLRALRASNSDGARQALQREPHLKAAAVSSVLIGVTEFFREPAVFDFLAYRVLPIFAERSRSVRALSVGVSRGQELYSLAILLAEAGLLERSDLLGVDCRHDAIAAAADARFTAAEIASLGERRRAKFFRREGDFHRAEPALRNRLRWRTSDLFTLTGEGPFDLTFFRNVAIYFEPAAAEEAWIAVCAHVSPGGLLVTGRAERPPPQLGLTRVAPSIYRKGGA